MSESLPLWISEQDVVDVMHLGEAIDALEGALLQEAQGRVRNMTKTHITWEGGSLHAIGALSESHQIVVTKTWAHTTGGATPLLLMWSDRTGALLAVIEAFALGQMRTAAMTGVATRWLAQSDAKKAAVIGTGKQALAQVGAVAAVAKVECLTVFSRDAKRRQAFAELVRESGFTFSVEAASSASAAVADADIVTLVTRATEPFLEAPMLAANAHVNAIGAITPEREEMAQDVVERADLVVVDNIDAAKRLSTELKRRYDAPSASWESVIKMSALIAAGAPRQSDAGVSIFKSMGMGVSDLALAVKVFERAQERQLGRPFPHPRKVRPRLIAA